MKMATHNTAIKTMNTIAFLVDEGFLDKEFSRKEYVEARKNAPEKYGKILGFPALDHRVFKVVRKEPMTIKIKEPRVEEYMALDTGEKIASVEDWNWRADRFSKKLICERLNGGKPLQKVSISSDTLDVEKFFYKADLRCLARDLEEDVCPYELEMEIKDLQDHISKLENLVATVNDFANTYKEFVEKYNILG